MTQLQFNGDLLRQRREERGLYLKDVAAAVGYSAAAVGQWETGKRTPSATAAKKLADFFGVDSAAFWIDPTAPAHDFTIKTQGDLLRAIRALDAAGANIGVEDGKVTITYTFAEGQELLKQYADLLFFIAQYPPETAEAKVGREAIDAWAEKHLPELDELLLTHER